MIRCTTYLTLAACVVAAPSAVAQQPGTSYSHTPYAGGGYDGTGGQGGAGTGGSSGGDSASAAAPSGGGSAHALEVIFKAGGVPNRHGQVAWPEALRLLPAASQLHQLEAQLQLAAEQVTAGGANPQLLDEIRLNVEGLRQLLLADKAGRHSLSLAVYEDAEDFLQKLKKTPKILAASAPAARSEANASGETLYSSGPYAGGGYDGTGGQGGAGTGGSTGGDSASAAAPSDSSPETTLYSGSSGGDSASAAAPSGGGSAHALDVLLKAGGVPNRHGQVAWPEALRLLPAASQLHQLEAQLQLAAEQVTAGGANPQLLDEIRLNVEGLRQLLLADKAGRHSLSLAVYEDAEDFLQKLKKTPKILAASAPAARSQATAP